MIPNHGYRLYRQVMNINEPILNPIYKLKKDGNLYENKCPYRFIYKSIIARYFNYKVIWKLYEKENMNGVFDLLKIYFEKTKELTDKKFPNSKFVILKYPEFDEYSLNDLERWKELEDEGFIIIDLKEITNVRLNDDKYRIPDDIHPNEKAWEVIVPALAKELNL